MPVANFTKGRSGIPGYDIHVPSDWSGQETQVLSTLVSYLRRWEMWYGGGQCNWGWQALAWLLCTAHDLCKFASMFIKGTVLLLGLGCLIRTVVKYMNMLVLFTDIIFKSLFDFSSENTRFNTFHSLLASLPRGSRNSPTVVASCYRNSALTDH